MSMISMTVRKTNDGEGSVNKTGGQKKIKLQMARHLKKMLDREKILVNKFLTNNLSNKTRQREHQISRIRCILDKYKIYGQVRVKLNKLLEE